MRIRFIIFSLLCVFAVGSHAQSIQLDQRADRSVIEFADELFNMRSVSGSMLTQPLTRRTVAFMFTEADETNLTERQKKELLFYRLAFSKDLDPDQRPALERPFRGLLKGLKRYKQPDLLYYHEGDVTVTLNPILGGTYMSNKNGVNYQRRMGGDLQAQIGRIGLYGSVREVYEFKPLSKDSLTTPKEGSLYKYNADGSGEYSDTRGGITYGWKHGYVGLVRDDIKWGYGYYGSNIFDINTAPFTQLKLHLAPTEWFQFDYFHGSMQSDVVDSSTIANVGGVVAFDFFNKYVVANMISVRPWKPLWLSFGNSMIYSSNTPEPTFFIPVMFYKSADHYLNRRNNRAGGNAQMFGAVSLRPGKGLHFYSTLFFDELSTRRMFDSERHSNWFSIKSGFRWTNILPNTTLTFEHLRSNAMVYKHFLQTTDYTNAGYNMGHYLRDNAREYIVAIKFKPLYWLSFEGMYQFAQKGEDVNYDLRIINPNTQLQAVLGIDYLANTQWIQSVYSFQVAAQPIYRWRFTARIDRIQRPHENASYQMPYFKGNNTTFSLGMHYGF